MLADTSGLGGALQAGAGGEPGRGTGKGYLLAQPSPRVMEALAFMSDSLAANLDPSSLTGACMQLWLTAVALHPTGSGCSCCSSQPRPLVTHGCVHAAVAVAAVALHSTCPHPPAHATTQHT